MFRRFFSSFSAPTPASGAPRGVVPPGERIYAIGDIHGRLDLLDDILARIDADDAARAPIRTTLILLGDLIDRGPESAQVIDRLMRLAEGGRPVRFLSGNHEEVFLKAMRGEKGALPFFLRIGGRETVLSYGIDEDEYNRADYTELFDIMTARIPAEHVAFVESFEDMIVIGDYAFVHAGVQPRTPLEEQKVSALRWIRDEFLDHRAPLEKIIIHGHTITQDVEETPCRIGIDTGAYATGRLTAMGFEGDERWTIQTEAEG
jgi:serine/threonine protein phosphatase 1